MMSLAAFDFLSHAWLYCAAVPLAKPFAICEAMRPARENDEAKSSFLHWSLSYRSLQTEPPEPDGCPPEVSKQNRYPPTAKSST